MADIGICWKKKTLEYKRALKDVCYWDFPRPVNVKPGDKLWIASDGHWRGYFIIEGCHFVANRGSDSVWFNPESWHEADGGPRKPFQGYTYHVPRCEHG